MKKYLKYIISCLILITIVSCSKEEPFTFNDKPSFDFSDSEINPAIGFISESSLFVGLNVNLIGNLLSEDMTLNVVCGGDARPGVDYVVPTTFTFPKDSATAVFEVEILKAEDIESFEEGKTLTISFSPDDKYVDGYNPSVAIKIEGGIPSQWIGCVEGFITSMFNSGFAPCTKARYRYVYKKLGFYDFTTIPGYGTSAMVTTLRTYKSYLNQQIALDNAERINAGLETLKDDDGSELTF